MKITKRQALFVKYLATRFDYNYFTNKEPRNIFGDIIDKDPGTSFRNTAMYFYARYPDQAGWPDSKDYYKSLGGKWWEADRVTSQIDGCILIDRAKEVLGESTSKRFIKETNW